MCLKAGVTLLMAVCVWLTPECVCFPNGSVAFSCGTMMPVHPPATPSNASPPFSLSTSAATYLPGGVITVTVEVKNSSAVLFQGFLIQARSLDNGGVLQWPVGRFTNINTSMLTPLNCNNQENSTVSQASGAQKNKVQLTWEAPSDSNYGNIFFSATVVQSYKVFWVQLNSSSVTLEGSGSSATGVGSSSALLFVTLLTLCVY